MNITKEYNYYFYGYSKEEVMEIMGGGHGSDREPPEDGENKAMGGGHGSDREPPVGDEN